MVYKQNFLNTVFRFHFEISQDAVGLSKAIDFKTDCKTRTVKYRYRDSTLKGKETKWEERQSSKYQVTIERDIDLQRDVDVSVSVAWIYTNISPDTEANAVSTPLGRFVNNRKDQGAARSSISPWFGHLSRDYILKIHTEFKGLVFRTFPAVLYT